MAKLKWTPISIRLISPRVSDSTVDGQWRIQEFQKGDAEQGVWGTEVHQRGPGAEPRWGSGGFAPRSYGHCNATFTTRNKRKLQYEEYTTGKNRTNLAQEIGLCGPVKATLSTTSTGSTGVVCACTWISANNVSRSSLIDDRR